MSLVLAQQEIERFLANNSAEVLSISGRWGVGKTHCWETALKAARNSKALPRDNYAYVSAFGLRNIDALKAAIFQSTVRLTSKDIEPSLDSLAEHLSSLDGAVNLVKRGWRKWLPQARAVASMIPVVGKGANLLLPDASLLIKNQLICIDDIERAGEGLKVTDILGLVSQLREKKGCKVVLLLNEEGLGKNGEEYRRYLEKVVDQAVVFDPTPAEAAATVLNPTKPIDAELAQWTAKLGITNIRTILRIRRFVAMVSPRLLNHHPIVIREVISGITLYAWTIFEPGIGPPPSYLRSFSSYAAMFAKENPTPEEARWNTVLSDYGYKYFDEMDSVLLAGLEQGAFDLAAFDREAKAMHDAQSQSDVKVAVRRPWNIFGQGFGDDEAALKQAMISSIEVHGALMTPPEVDDVVSILREFDEGNEADRLIDLYLTQVDNCPRGFFILDQYHPSRAFDTKLQDALKAKLATFVIDRDPIEIFERIDRDRSWGRADTDFLASLPVEEYVRMFKAAAPDRHSTVIRSAMTFRNLANPEETHAVIGERAIEALKLIGQESRLNAMRVKPYIGIAPTEEGAVPPAGL
jgi:hypothetical protein